MSVYGESVRIQSECGNMWARVTPNAGSSYALFSSVSIVDFEQANVSWVDVNATK